MSKMNTHSKQRGAVSLFVVIFSTLLVTIVTISFVRIMLQNQQNASIVDLSQSAYDSALAGVEDAKRVLADDKLVNGDQCNSVKQSLGAAANDTSETKIQQQIGDGNSFEQAYTCVKVDTEPRELVADLNYQNSDSASVMLPLKTVNNQRFSTIEIEWSLPVNDDESEATATTLPESGGITKLVRGSAQWGVRSPALMRAQLIQYNGSFSFGDMDSSDNKSSDNARTKFLYPVAFSASPSQSPFSNDKTPTGVNCIQETATCSVRLTIGGNYKENVFLRLNALYNNAHVTIRAYPQGTTNPNQAVKFSGIQAVVDSTGRAGDAFRRVSAVVNLKANDSFPYPQAALELDGNLCKTFGVTDKSADYSPGACDPTLTTVEDTP